MSTSKWHFFICHASEDKDAVARPLAKALRGVGMAVWFDEFSIRPGDSIRRKIDVGLRHSRFGIVILSSAFLGKEWPNWELDGLVEYAMSDRAERLIPVWHAVTRDEVREYSAPLAGISALQTSSGIEQVAKQILRSTYGINEVTGWRFEPGYVRHSKVAGPGAKRFPTRKEWVEWHAYIHSVVLVGSTDSAHRFIRSVDQKYQLWDMIGRFDEDGACALEFKTLDCIEDKDLESLAEELGLSVQVCVTSRDHSPCILTDHSPPPWGPI